MRFLGILLDGHNDIALYKTDAGHDLGETSNRFLHTDLRRLKQRAVGTQFIYSCFARALKSM